MKPHGVIRWYRKACKQPVWIRKVVEIPEILEAAIAGFELIPLRFLDAQPHLAVGVRSPTRRCHQQSIEQAALALLGSHQESGIEKARTRLVIQVAFVLIYVANDSLSTVAKLYGGCDLVV